MVLKEKMLIAPSPVNSRVGVEFLHMLRKHTYPFYLNCFHIPSQYIETIRLSLGLFKTCFILCASFTFYIEVRLIQFLLFRMKAVLYSKNRGAIKITLLCHHYHFISLLGLKKLMVWKQAWVVKINRRHSISCRVMRPHESVLKIEFTLSSLSKWSLHQRSGYLLIYT